MYDIEKLYQAKDIGDAIRALKEDPEAVVISGGSDVLIKVREASLPDVPWSAFTESKNWKV